MTIPSALGLPRLSAVLSAVGIGRSGETHPRRPHLKYLVPAWCPVLKSVHLNPWSSKFRLGWALGWDGLYWHRAIGIKGADWNERSHPYYGPPPRLARVRALCIPSLGAAREPQERPPVLLRHGLRLPPPGPALADRLHPWQRLPDRDSTRLRASAPTGRTAL